MIRQKSIGAPLRLGILIAIGGIGFAWCQEEKPGAMAEGPMAVVKDQKPVATLVIDAQASPGILEAAQTLQAYVQKSTGAVLPIERHSPAGGATIQIGETPFVKQLALDLKTLGDEGFLMEGRNGSAFIIAGGNEAGTVFGVYDFLERYVGVRWLLPGASGEVVPRHTGLEVPPARVLEKPVYVSRMLSPLDWLGPAWEANRQWARFNRIRGGIAFMHNLYKIFPPPVFARSHPEFYPWVDGKRLIPKPADSRGLSWQPNFSAEGIAEAAAAHILDYFKAHPGAGSFSLGINDSHAFDQSPQSLARRSGKTNALGLPSVSDDYFLWANAVVQKVVSEYPDKWFGTLAYTEVFDPPEKAGVHPRIIPYMTYDRMQWAKPALRKADQDRTEAWARVAPTLGWYDYTYGSFYRAPRVYFHLMQEYLSWAAKHHVRHYYAEAYPNWIGEGPKTWVQAKLLWNPDQDVDALLDDWYRNAVGAAAAPFLKAYFERWENFWTGETPESSWFAEAATFSNFATPAYLGLVPQSQIQACQELMDKARELAGTPDEKTRMERFYRMWEYYRDGVVTYQAEELGKSSPPQTGKEALAALEKAGRTLDQSRKRKESMESFTQEDWNPNRFFYNTRWARPNDPNWGASLLWSVAPWLDRSPEVKARVEALAREGALPVRQHALIFLAAQKGEGEPLLKNGTFGGHLKGWRVAKRADEGEIKPASGSESGGVVFCGPVNGSLIQAVPWEAGLYYAILRYHVPQGAQAPRSSQVVFAPAAALKGLDGLRFVLPALEIASGDSRPTPGETLKAVLPLVLPEGDGKFTSLNVSIRAILQKADERLVIESIQLYRVKGANTSEPGRSNPEPPAASGLK